jgi:hypothetical protein
MGLANEQALFLDSLRCICLRVDVSLPLNPIADLTGRSFSAWQERRKEARDRLLGGRTYLSSRDRQEIEIVSRETLSSWTRTYGFLAATEETPANWILEWAGRFYCILVGERVTNAAPGEKTDTMAAFVPFGVTGRSPMPPPPRARRNDETKRQYERRVGLESLELSRALVKLRGAASSHLSRRKQGKYQDRHYEFLAYYFCGVSRQAVQARFPKRDYTGSAITNGAKSAAAILCLRCPRANSAKVKNSIQS